MRQHSFLITLGIFLISCFSLSAQNNRDIFSSGIQLQGEIDGKYPIEMHLAGDDHNGFFDFENSFVKNIKGEYYYKSQIRPIALSGQFNPESQMLFVKHYEGDVETEVFHLKWEKNKAQFEGFWYQPNKSKEGKPVILKLIEFGDWNIDHSLFSELLNSELENAEEEWESYQYRIEGFAPNSKGITIKDFLADDGGIIHFSEGRLVFGHNYSNAGHGTQSIELFQILPSKSGRFVLQYSQNQSIESLDEGDESCEFLIKVWECVDGKWIQNDNCWEAVDFQRSFFESGESCHGDWELEVLSDCIRIGNKKLDWLNNRFVDR